MGLLTDLHLGVEPTLLGEVSDMEEVSPLSGGDLRRTSPLSGAVMRIG